MSILSSVGDWKKGAKNLPKDVGTIQTMLTALSKITKKKEFDPKGVDNKIAKPPAQSNTVKAIIAFQSTFTSLPDGLIEPGRTTIRKLTEALKLGEFPPKPSFQPIVGNAGKAAVFGSFAWEAQKDTAGNVKPGSSVTITDGWDKNNLITVEVPHLGGIPLGWGGKTSKMRFHKQAAAQLVALWEDWYKAGLLNRIQTYDGSYNARLQRGSSDKLSSHAWGTAFDINASTNGIGKIPPFLGQPGCLRELVQIANSHGFYWGGHFSSRPDGMHFEVAVIGASPSPASTK